MYLPKFTSINNNIIKNNRDDWFEMRIWSMLHLQLFVDRCDISVGQWLHLDNFYLQERIFVAHI